MLTENSRRGLVLLAIAIIGMLFVGGRTPAHAACSPGAPDKPDLSFVDSNCDGIDGDKASALFVAPAAGGGNDANNGSFGHPKATVAAAVTAALPAGKDVYVAAGIYDGKVSFLSAAGNIGVYGGYAAGTWQRSAANVTTLRAPGQVVGVALPRIVLQLVTVQSVSDPTYLNSYGVRAFNGGTVALSRVTVNTVPGRNGTDGGIPPAPPTAAPDGLPGAKSCDYFGGLGGGFGIPDIMTGGTGGAAWNQTQAWKGWDGFGYAGVQGGWGGQYTGQSGGQGAPGLPGTDGQGGSAALNFSALFYQAMAGSPGTKGTRGAGGGGGAAGEACLTGSGGGAGGYPGDGGMGGWGGGGSIGVFAGTGARVVITDGSAIHTANGGKGGTGGTYQEGGAGGKGGPALDEWIGNQYFKSGAGGDGGYGGHGGRGGGGAGGASIGVLAINSSSVIDEDTTKITLGAGGQGGIGGVNGKNGVSLISTQVTTAGGSIPAVGDFDGDGVDDASDACPIVSAPGGCPAADGGGTQGGGTPSGGTTGGTTGGTSTGTTGTTGTTPAGTTPAGSTAATVSVLPASSCMPRRAFTIRINARRAHLKSARLKLDGRRLRLVKGPRIWKARVNLSRSTRTRHTLTIRGTLRSGRSFKQTRRYRTCAR